MKTCKFFFRVSHSLFSLMSTNVVDVIAATGNADIAADVDDDSITVI